MPVKPRPHRGLSPSSYDFTGGERVSYNAYGKQTITSATGAVRAKSAVGFDRGFTGYVADQETGLLHARARQYSPTLGRFIGRDPYRQSGLWPSPLDGYPNGTNSYGAVFIPNGLDPTGLKDCSKAKNEKNVTVSTSPDFNATGVAAPAQSHSVDDLVDQIKSQLADCDCLKVLTIMAHGCESGMQVGSNAPDINNPGHSGWVTSGSGIGESAKYLGEKLRELVCFCPGATVFLQSCNVGLGPMAQNLADNLGLPVNAPNGFSYPNGTPGPSPVSASDPHYPAHPGSSNTTTTFTPMPATTPVIVPLPAPLHTMPVIVPLQH